MWTSEDSRHDASVLRLQAAVEGIQPLPMAAALPVLEDSARVYIIGHPGGRDLAFSFQDNELLDHEGPTKGKPQIPGVCRVHYRAPTEGGSSGSPVFNSRLWEVIALHHKGGQIGMPKLNGEAGSYARQRGDRDRLDPRGGSGERGSATAARLGNASARQPTTSGRELDYHAAGLHHPSLQHQEGLRGQGDRLRADPSRADRTALDAARLGGGTTGKIIDAGNIREDMFGLIIEADLVVCDITVHNANVFYELGIRHALRKKGTVLIKGAPVADSTPFDILTDRYLEYSVDEPGKKKDELAEVIRATLASSRETDSPIFKMLPTLPELDPAAVQVVPTDFTEEVARAKAAKSRRLAAALGFGGRPAYASNGRRCGRSARRSGSWRTMSARAGPGCGFATMCPTISTPTSPWPTCSSASIGARSAPSCLEASNQAIAAVLANKRTTAEPARGGTGASRPQPEDALAAGF